MARRKRLVESQPTHLVKNYEMQIDGHLIEKGDVIKIAGQYGLKFKFDCLVTNTHNGVQWIDCFELDKGQVRSWRSFRPDMAKRIPKRRKSVSRD